MKTTRAVWMSVAMAVLLPGCVSITPATYIVSPDIRQSLKPFEGSKVKVTSAVGPGNFDPMCRAAGNLRFENGLTVPQFVKKSFNDEFKFAGIEAENGVQLSATLTRIEFSSSASLVNGYWDLGLTLASSNGATMSTDVHYDFQSGFNALTACNNTSQALAQAAQALVRKTVADPRFASLIRSKI